MPRTKIHRARTNLLDSIAKVIDSVFSGFFSSIGKEADLLMDRIEARTLSLETRAMRALASSFLTGMASVFLLISLYFYMTEYQGMTRASSFLVLAISLFILSWVTKRYWGQNYGAKNY